MYMLVWCVCVHVHACGFLFAYSGFKFYQGETDNVYVMYIHTYIHVCNVFFDVE